jgi:hypothetical protein
LVLDTLSGHLLGLPKLPPRRVLVAESQCRRCSVQQQPQAAATLAAAAAGSTAAAAAAAARAAAAQHGALSLSAQAVAASRLAAPVESGHQDELKAGCAGRALAGRSLSPRCTEACGPRRRRRRERRTARARAASLVQQRGQEPATCSEVDGPQGGLALAARTMPSGLARHDVQGRRCPRDGSNVPGRLPGVGSLPLYLQVQRKMCFASRRRRAHRGRLYPEPHSVPPARARRLNFECASFASRKTSTIRARPRAGLCAVKERKCDRSPVVSRETGLVRRSPAQSPTT